MNEEICGNCGRTINEVNTKIMHMCDVCHLQKGTSGRLGSESYPEPKEGDKRPTGASMLIDTFDNEAFMKEKEDNKTKCYICGERKEINHDTKIFPLEWKTFKNPEIPLCSQCWLTKYNQRLVGNLGRIYLDSPSIEIINVKFLKGVLDFMDKNYPSDIIKEVGMREHPIEKVGKKFREVEEVIEIYTESNYIYYFLENGKWDRDPSDVLRPLQFIWEWKK